MFHTYTKNPGEATWHAATYRDIDSPDVALKRLVADPSQEFQDGTLLILVGIGGRLHETPAVWVYTISIGRPVVLDENGRPMPSVVATGLRGPQPEPLL